MPSRHPLDGASGIIVSEPECLRNRGVSGVNPNPRSGEKEGKVKDVPGETVRQEERGSSSFLHFLFHLSSQRIE